MRKVPCNFHHHQILKTLEISDEGEVADPFSSHLHQGKSPSMLALDQVLQLPTEIENNSSDRDKSMNIYFMNQKYQIHQAQMLHSGNNRSYHLLVFKSGEEYNYMKEYS